jgi:hypothetical protein
MDAGDDLADACLDASLFTQVSDIFAGLSDDDACVLSADEGAEGEGVLGRGRVGGGTGGRLRGGCGGR